MNQFDALKTKNDIINFIREYYNKNNIKGVVIGISGGKDSAVVAALFCEAIGKENVLGLTLPCFSNDSDKLDAEIISNYYGFKMINFELTDIYNSFKEELFKNEKCNNEQTENSDINLKPRLRMATLYYFAALYSKIKKETYIVAGTSNKCEKYVGYFTKGGDNVCDIQVLSDLSVNEVIKVGEVLKVPKKVLYKTPSDGISNKTDEEKLNVRYDEIEKYIENPLNVNKESREKIKKLHINNKHKFVTPTFKKI